MDLKPVVVLEGCAQRLRGLNQLPTFHRYFLILPWRERTRVTTTRSSHVWHLHGWCVRLIIPYNNLFLFPLILQACTVQSLRFELFSRSLPRSKYYLFNISSSAYHWRRIGRSFRWCGGAQKWCPRHPSGEGSKVRIPFEIPSLSLFFFSF